MSTQSVTTAVGKVEGEINYVESPQQPTQRAHDFVGRGGHDQFPCLGKSFHRLYDWQRRLSGNGDREHHGLDHLRCGAPRIISVLASMAGFAVGVFLATKIVRQHAR